MTDRERLSAIMARLEDRLRPHAASPVTARRKATDTPAPNGLAANYGWHRNTNMRTADGGVSPTYKPRAADYAGSIPNARATAPDVVKVNGIRVVGTMTPENARATGEDNARRGWVTARGNLERDAGDVLPDAGAHYPSRVTPRGNLGPSARY
jgi:hypothetical protein